MSKIGKKINKKITDIFGDNFSGLQLLETSDSKLSSFKAAAKNLGMTIEVFLKLYASFIRSMAIIQLIACFSCVILTIIVFLLLNLMFKTYAIILFVLSFIFVASAILIVLPVIKKIIFPEYFVLLNIMSHLPSYQKNENHNDFLSFMTEELFCKICGSILVIAFIIFLCLCTIYFSYELHAYVLLN